MKPIVLHPMAEAEMRAAAGYYQDCQSDSDARFAFIAGYTEGGFPYGTTWDELLADAHREEGGDCSQKFRGGSG
jgi:hypothetical protein